MLNSYHLKYFCDACRSKSITEAAKRNFVSHSAVSQAIRSLEESLGAKLLIHAKRQFEMTPEGQAFFEKAEQILNELASLPSVLEQKNAPLSGKLRIGLSLSVWNGVLKETLARFLTKYPQVELSLLVGNSDSLAYLLKSREIDLGFGIEDGSFTQLERHQIKKGHFILAAQKGRSPNHRYFVGDKGNEVRILLEGLREKAVQAEISFVQSWSVIASLASQGLGTGLIPDFCLGSEANLVRVSPRLALPEYKIFAFYRSTIHLPREARALLAFNNTLR